MRKTECTMFILYPEHIEGSNPLEFVKNICDPYMVDALSVSPIHTPPEGKQHYHVVIYGNYDAKIKKAIGNAMHCPSGRLYEDWSSCIEAYEYLTHKNNPDKEQFSDDVVPMSFGEYKEYLSSSDYTDLFKREKVKNRLRDIKTQIVDMIDSCPRSISYGEIIAWSRQNDLDIFDYVTTPNGASWIPKYCEMHKASVDDVVDKASVDEVSDEDIKKDEIIDELKLKVLRLESELHKVYYDINHYKCLVDATDINGGQMSFLPPDKHNELPFI